MGTSNWQNVSYCIDIIRRINPKSVLDVGVGFGRWGIISREFLDVWNGRVDRNSWSTRIEGIEAFSGNIDEYHKNFYTKIWGMDARDYFKAITTRYDLIIFGDVLEHFYKIEGNHLLDIAVEYADFVMINVPLGGNWEQGDLYGNEYEEHKSEWNLQDFNKWPIVRVRQFKDFIGRDFATVILSKQSSISNVLLNKMQLDNEIKSIGYELLNDAEYHRFLEQRKNKSEQDLCNIIAEGENRILNAMVNERKNIKVRVGEKQNKSSNGKEVWIYHISSDEIPTIDLNKVKKDNRWLSQAEQISPTGTCLIASEIGAEIEFEIIGDELRLKCLSHPWSGNVQIIKDDVNVMSIDLFSNTQKVIDIIINLKEVD